MHNTSQYNPMDYVAVVTILQSWIAWWMSG